jgi:hypothetical protein
MALTAAEIAKQALRDLNIIDAGRTLTQDQIDEGLFDLRSYLGSLFGDTIGVPLMDWPVPPNTTAPVLSRYPLYAASDDFPDERVVPYPPQNVRLLLGQANNFTIFLPPYPSDGARFLMIDMNVASPTYTIDANGRKILDALLLTGTPTDLDGREFFYRADLGDWVELATITETSVSPLPSFFDDMLILGVARRAARRYGKSLSNEQLADFRRMTRIARSRYTQSQPKPPADPQPFLDPQTRQSGSGTHYGYGSTNPFE